MQPNGYLPHSSSSCCSTKFLRQNFKVSSIDIWFHIVEIIWRDVCGSTQFIIEDILENFSFPKIIFPALGVQLAIVQITSKVPNRCERLPMKAKEQLGNDI